MGFSALLARLLVHCVLACTSPVAVRVAVHGWSPIRARDEASGVGQGTTEVGVVVAVKHIPDRAYRSSSTRCKNPLPSADAPRSLPLVALRRRSMQDPGFEIPRISLPGRWVNSSGGQQASLRQCLDAI